VQAEDIMRSQLKPSIGSPEAFLKNPSPTENGWLIADKIATLREAFQNTPHWLGFNIELKYPTDAELAVMPTRFYSRNYFCDEVLRVRASTYHWAIHEHHTERHISVWTLTAHLWQRETTECTIHIAQEVQEI